MRKKYEEIEYIVCPCCKSKVKRHRFDKHKITDCVIEEVKNSFKKKISTQTGWIPKLHKICLWVAN